MKTQADRSPRQAMNSLLSKQVNKFLCKHEWIWKLLPEKILNGNVRWVESYRCKHCGSSDYEY